MTAGVNLNRTSSLKMTYGEAVERNEDGVDGWLGRIVLSVLF